MAKKSRKKIIGRRNTGGLATIGLVLIGGLARSTTAGGGGEVPLPVPLPSGPSLKFAIGEIIATDQQNWVAEGNGCLEITGVDPPAKPNSYKGLVLTRTLPGFPSKGYGFQIPISYIDFSFYHVGWRRDCL